MGLTLDELEQRALASRKQAITFLKKNYHLSRRLGFSSSEAVILQSQKRELIIRLAIERGLINDANDPKVK